MRSVETSHAGTDMIRAPNATEVSHLFALAEHEIVKGRLTEALILLRFIRSIDPEHTDAAARLALTLFRREQWNDAWDAFDIRFKLMSAQPAVKIRTADGGSRELPRWRGGEPPKSLLVMDEQGLGDTIQFMRYLRPLVERGVEINFVTHEILFDLIRSMGLPINLLPSNKPGSVNGATGWTPLLHIPRALGIDPKTYADNVPYISADPARVKSWARKMGSKDFKIGICWGGNRESPAEKGRSVPLEAFAPLAAIPGVRLFSLQKGQPTEEIKNASFRRDLYDFGDNFDADGQAFLDTAAIMTSLDLIVTADTSIAHVAGALGRPVHVLLRVEPDWRWLARESDTVWYPSMRLFRQRVAGNWAEPMALIAADIIARTTQKADSPSLDVLPKVSMSFGDLAIQISDWSVKAKFDDVAHSDAEVRLGYLKTEWDNHFKDNTLLSSLQVEIQDLAHQIADTERKLRVQEEADNVDRTMLGMVRDIRSLKEKREDRARRIDALALSELEPAVVAEAEAAKPAKGGHKKKA